MSENPTEVLYKLDVCQQVAKAAESDAAVESQRSSLFVQIKEEQEEQESEESRQKAARRENRLVRNDVAKNLEKYYDV